MRGMIGRSTGENEAEGYNAWTNITNITNQVSKLLVVICIYNSAHIAILKMAASGEHWFCLLWVILTR